MHSCPGFAGPHGPARKKTSCVVGGATMGLALSLCAHDCWASAPTSEELVRLEAMVREFTPWPLGQLYALGLHSLIIAKQGYGESLESLGETFASLRSRRNLAPANSVDANGATLLSGAGGVSHPTLVRAGSPIQVTASPNGEADFDDTYLRTGMDWQPSPNSALAIEQGRVRVRLYGAGRTQMSVRLKHGWPMLTYRLKFD